jgi:membrane protease YdiL (CAAX protease family)
VIEPQPIPAPAKAPLWPAIAGFSGLLCAVAIAQVAVAALAALLHRHELARARDMGEALIALLTTGPMLTSGIAATCAAVIGTALLASRLLGGPIALRLRLGPSRFGPAGYALSLLGLLALGNALEGLAAHVSIPTFSLPALSAAAHGPLGQFVPLLLVGAVGAGFGEELFFRGFLARVLIARWSRTATIATCAACFGLLHGDPLHSPLAFVLGLFLGFVAEEAQSIRPSVFAHVLNNATSFLSDRYELGAHAQGPLGIAGSLAVMVGCAVLLRRQVSGSPGALASGDPG